MSEPTALDETRGTLPPLRIHHFLVWMAVVAVSISFSKSLTDERQYIAFVDLTSVTHTLIHALGVTVVGFGLMWRHAGRRFFDEPGHGLLLQQCLYFAWRLLGIIVYACYVTRNASGALVGWKDNPTVVRWYFEWGWVVREGGYIVLSLICAIWIARSCRWRDFYVTAAIVVTLQSAFFLASIKRGWVDSSQFLNAWETWLEPVSILGPQALVAGLLIYIAILDWRDGLKHHWSHWAGVVSFLLTASVSLILGLWEFLYPPNWISYPYLIS